MPPSPSKTRRKAEVSLSFQRLARRQGYTSIAGVDEAGRGPLAGPVVAAACLVHGEPRFPGLNDSKLLTEIQRQKLFTRIQDHQAVKYSVGIVEPDEIDRINIYQATIRAMHLALDGLCSPPDYLLVDAVPLAYKQLPCEALIHGDRRCQAIALASVVAKETRDALMKRYHELYPAYGFDRHKGYGTKAHQLALAEHGPCPIHRRSFAPVAALLAESPACGAPELEAT